MMCKKIIANDWKTNISQNERKSERRRTKMDGGGADSPGRKMCAAGGEKFGSSQRFRCVRDDAAG